MGIYEISYIALNQWQNGLKEQVMFLRVKMSAESEKGLKSYLEENEMMKAAVEQMDYVVPWTSFPGNSGLQAEQFLLDVRDQILGGSVSVEEGLKSTQDKINELLK